ncbi:tetA, partial [Symbiodinium sp. CCMP2592]
MKTTFFAQKRLAVAQAAAGTTNITSELDINCARTPKQLLCKVGAADAAYWDAILEGLASVLAVPSALTLGILSDLHGRRPFLQLKAALNVVSALLLLSSTHAGASLWPFLWASSLDQSIDAVGVMLAVLADLTQDYKIERSATLGLLGAFVTGVACFCMAAAASMPSSVAAQTVLLTATLKLGFLLFLLPETSETETEELESQGGRAAVWGRIPEMLQEGVNILRRHQVLQRLALVLCLAGAGFTARNLFLRFYLASKLGADKADFAILLPASLPGKMVTFALILPMLVHTCGELAALKVALPISGVLTLCILASDAFWQVVVCCAVLGGPALMFAPLMLAMKANLVGDDEQGKVQGIVAALRALANAAVGFLLGNGFHAGSQPMGGVQAGLLLVVLLEFVASLVALTLPNSYIIGEFAIASSVVAGEEISDTELVCAVDSQDDPADT